MRTKGILLGVVGLALVCGCKSSGPKFDPRARSAAAITNFEQVVITNQLRPEWLEAPTNSYVLGPGDVLEISTADNPSSRTAARVGADGKIYFLYLTGLDVWGMTINEARESLQKEFGKTVNNPELYVTLQTPASKRVWMLGRFANPGIYQMVTPVRLLEAVAQAGGPATSNGANTTDLADLKHSFLLRNGEFIPVDFDRLINQGDLSRNIYLQSEDFIYVPSSLNNQVYVLGSVADPGGVPYTGELSLVGAISRRGGPLQSGYVSHVAILRGSLTEPRIAIVDYKAIVKGKATDVILEPRDIVYIPKSAYDRIYRYAESAVRYFVGSLASNWGAFTVNPNGSGILGGFGGGGGFYGR